MPDEEQRDGHHHGANEVPSLSSSVTSPRLVAEKSYNGRGRGIGYLSNQKQETGVGVVEPYDKVIKDEEIGEPHARTHVVEYVPDAKGHLANEGKVAMAVLRLHDVDLSADQPAVDGIPRAADSSHRSGIDAIRAAYLYPVAVSPS